MAMLLFKAGKTVMVIIALVLFPRVFEYLRNLLATAAGQPHVLTAWAKGLGPIRVFFRHVLPNSIPELLALAGVSVSIAFGACIPAETFCDLPGIGQLAWHAAMARDLPVLVTLTLLITFVTLACNSMPDLLGRRRT
jgi:peptide/nickel transport system permease protein